MSLFPTSLQPGSLHEQLLHFYAELVKNCPVNWLKQLKHPPKALVWKQPYGPLMLYGKQETRSWDTNVRGIILICAGGTSYTIEELEETSGEVQMQRMLAFKDDPLFDETYKAIGVGILTGSRHMQPEDEGLTFVKYKEPWIGYHNSKYKKEKPVEKRLWVHEYVNAYPIEPFDFRGNQKWTNLDVEVLSKVIVKPKLY